MVSVGVMAVWCVNAGVMATMWCVNVGVEAALCCVNAGVCNASAKAP